MDQPIANLKSGIKTTEFWLCAVLAGWGAYQSRPVGQPWWMQALTVAMAIVPTLFYTAQRRTLKLAQIGANPS